MKYRKKAKTGCLSASYKPVLKRCRLDGTINQTDYLGDVTVDHDYGWRGKQVRHADGRTGKIVSEDGWGPDLTLQILVDGGDSVNVKLRHGDFAGGEPGWEWLCDRFDGDSHRWISLGKRIG